MSATSLMVRMFVVFSTSPSTRYGATEGSRDRRGSQFWRAGLKFQSAFGILGALAVAKAPTSAFWGRMPGPKVSGPKDPRETVRHSGGASSVVPVENRVFLGEEGALFARFLGIPGAESRHSGGI